jgi:hypothetical protein
MSHPVHSRRARAAVAAGALSLALSLVAAPVAVAQDDGPDTTLRNLVAAISAKDFGSLSSYFCPEFAGQVAGLDLSAITAGLPEGTDAQAVLDAFIIQADVQSADIVSQSDEEAVVKLVATVSLNVDAEALGPFIAAMLAQTTGLEGSPDPAMVEMMTGMIDSEFTAQATTIDEEVTLVPGDTRAWVVCDQLGMASASPAAFAEAVDAEASPAA